MLVRNTGGSRIFLVRVLKLRSRILYTSYNTDGKTFLVLKMNVPNISTLKTILFNVAFFRFRYTLYFYFETYVFQRVEIDGAEINCGNHYFGSYILPKFGILLIYTHTHNTVLYSLA